MNSFDAKKKLSVGSKEYSIFDLKSVAEKTGVDLNSLPFSIRVLLENLLRREDGKSVSEGDIKALANWNPNEKSDQEIAFAPARVVLQDFTGVPAVVDLAAMRDQIVKLGGDPSKINPQEPVDLVIDHSVQVDAFGSKEAFDANVKREFERNKERYEFLKWGQKAFDNFGVVPPGTGIVHQVNLEYLARVVMTKEVNGETLAYPDTLVGTDSHTTMINGLGVLGWGVGGIEAEAAMLGQPVSMLIPQVVGFKLTGELKDGVTATDLVLTIVEMLRAKGVVGKFVEFYGPALEHLSLADRATIANMAPEYGATMGFFPVDDETLNYMRLTARDANTIALAEAYLREQGLFHTADTPDPNFSDTLELDVSTVTACMAGPKRPQDRILLENISNSFKSSFEALSGSNEPSVFEKKVAVSGDESFEMEQGSVVIAAITSCTNTSNPSVMVGAGLVAKKAVEKGLMTKPWVKTSLAPGSQVVNEYLDATGLLPYLEQLKFHIVGYGCTTCIGNSGPLPEVVGNAVKENDLVASAVLSGNRNFEGRVNPLVKANYLASPPLVVAYALAGSVQIDLTKDAIGQDKDGNDVYLKDIWPSTAEVKEALQSIDSGMFGSKYANVFDGNDEWQSIEAALSDTYAWNEKSTYVKQPPFFDGMTKEPGDIQPIENARVLVMVGDSVTTDHISPAGSFPEDGPAGKYLLENGVAPKDFNSFGSRRGNHEVMMRGTFANIRLRNQLAPGTEGGFTNYLPEDRVTSIYEAAMEYQKSQTPTIVLAGKEYGTGSSRDWAAKGPALLGIKAAIAESFERIHRSNLIGMGIIPFQYKEGESRESLGLTGKESFTFVDVENIQPGKEVQCEVTNGDQTKQITVVCRIDTPVELEYVKHGGILQYVLRQLL